MNEKCQFDNVVGWMSNNPPKPIEHATHEDEWVFYETKMRRMKRPLIQRNYRRGNASWCLFFIPGDTDIGRCFKTLKEAYYTMMNEFPVKRPPISNGLNLTQEQKETLKRDQFST